MIVRIGKGVGNMADTIPVLDLKKYKNIDEKFIYSVEGIMRQNILQDIYYSMLPYPMFCYLPATIYEISINCILVITNKRLIIFETDLHGHIDNKNVHQFNYNKINIVYKKSLGKRIFVIDKIKKRFFRYYDDILNIEIDSNHIKQADNLYSILLEEKLIKVNK